MVQQKDENNKRRQAGIKVSETAGQFCLQEYVRNSSFLTFEIRTFLGATLNSPRRKVNFLRLWFSLSFFFFQMRRDAKFNLKNKVLSLKSLIKNRNPEDREYWKDCW